MIFSGNESKGMIHYRIFKKTYILITLSLLLITLTTVYAQDSDNKKNKQQILINAANNSLWRLIRAIERDGYCSSRVALNIWHSTAIDADLFDQEKYNTFKKQIYEKSIDNSLRCFESSVLNEFFNDARICLHTWKIHTQELGIFDEAQYLEMKKRLEDSKLAKKK